MPTNYPAALDSFATKVDGVDDVLAADINKLQDAVLALQTKLGANGSDVVLRAATDSSDPPDILFQDGTGSEVGRIWKDPTQPIFLCRFSGVDGQKQIAHDSNLMALIGLLTTAGGLGTPAFCRGVTGEPGSFHSGASLHYTGGLVESVAKPVGGGTWIRLGWTAAADRGTLFVRVA